MEKYEFAGLTFPRALATLPKGTPASRLAYLRQHGKRPRVATWQGWNRESDSRTRWVERLDAAGLRLVGYADDLAGLRHRGWYTNEFQDSVYRGCVLQLPSRRGEMRFLAAYADPDNVGAFLVDVSRPAVFRERMNGGSYHGDGRDYLGSAARDCARAADDFARQCAEKEREYQEIASARLRFDELAEEIAQERRDVIALCAEARAARRMAIADGFSAICTTIRQHVRKALREIAKARSERARLESDYGRSTIWAEG
jgi:hypothetical protein